MGYTTKEIVELMEKAAELKVSIEVKDENFSVNINGRGNTAGTAATAVAAQETSTAAQPLNAPCEATGTAVKSPIVGTFYNAASPDKPPFVQVGQAIKKGDVLFIIESMKLMNEVQSECDGVVKEVVAQSGQAVEYGQIILILE